ncbi:MAG: M14 family zinc carboxypeptidase [Phycisphaerales bacterium JB065]
MASARFSTLLASLLLAAGSGVARADEAPPKPYEGYKLVEVLVTVPSQLAALDEIGNSLHCRPSVGMQMYAIDEDDLGQLDALNFQYEIISNDLQSVVDAETAQRMAARTVNGADFFSDYRTIDEINTYLDDLVAANPTFVSKFEIGQTLEGRTVYGVRIANLDPNDPEGDEASRPGFVINGCQHAREWISPASVMYLTDQLVNGYGSDEQITEYVDELAFYIIPVVNVDGYVYTFPASQGGSGQRLWRKNRRNNGNGTFGVDLNRNWSTAWGLPDGSSGDPGNDTYRGTAPFSEPESTNLSDFMASLPNVKGHLDIHSFSQLILGAWAYSETECPPREQELRLAQERQEEAMISVYGTNYEAGLGCDALLYAASGTAPDWSFHELGALSWTYELRDTGQFGFTLPPDQIVPTGQETMAGVFALADFLLTPLIIEPVNFSDLAPSDSTIPVQIEITEVNNEVFQIGSAKLSYRVQPESEYTTISLGGLGGTGELSASLPAQACGTVYELYFSAQTGSGLTVTYPENGAEQPLTIEVTDLTTVLDDDFSSDLGWTVGAPGDDATAGIWERVDPNGTSAQPSGALFGPLCYVTGQHPGGGDGANDVDGGQTTLLSPILDLSGTEDSSVEIQYWRWYSNSAGASPNADVFTVDISNDGGESWVNVEVVGPDGPEVSGGWFQVTIDPASLISLTDQMQMRFIAADEGSGSLVEAAIDGFLVRSAGCETVPCPGDTTGDGSVDLADLNLVLANFGTDTSDGDTNGDGSVDLADLNAVLAAFGESCL